MCAWPTVPIRDLVDNSARICASDVRTYWLLNLDQIEAGTGRVLCKERVQEDRIGSSTHAFEAGTVLYSKLRPYLNKVVVADEAGYATTELVPIRCRPDIADPQYLAHFLRSPTFVSFASETVAGAKMPRMVMGAFWAYELPLPSLTEQRRIAAILDQADALRAKRREALAQLDRLTQAIFIDMFGDPIANPRCWPLVKLEKVGTLDRGVSRHRPRNDPKLLGGRYPLIQTGDVANCDGYIRSFSSTYSDVGLQQSRLWPAGTLCITIAANIAKTGVLTFDACFPDSVVGFTALEPETVEYVRVWLSFLQRALEESAPESAQKNINLATLRGLSVPLPPLKLRRVFLSTINQGRKVAEECQASSRTMEQLFASLQHRAFRGEL